MTLVRMQGSDPVADRRGWLEERRRGIGSSDVAAIAGLSRWASPTSLYFEKRGELPLDHQPETSRMRLGRRAEAMAAAEFHDDTGLHLVGEQTVCQHPEFAHHRCTLDAFVAESPDADLDPASLLGIEETKSVSEFSPRWSKAGLPDDYAVQVQWALHVSGFYVAWVLVFYGLAESEVITVERDQAVIDDLLELADRFWQQVKNGTPPPADAHDATTDALTAVYPSHAPERVIDLDTEALGVIDEFRAAKAEVRRWQDQESRLANELRQYLGEAEAGYWNGVPVVTWRAHDRTSIDTKALRAAEPEIAKRFATTSPVRPLRLVEKK